MDYSDERWSIINLHGVKSGMYAVSDYGRVKNIKTDVLLHPSKFKNGYLYVSLMQVDNSVKKYGVHRLVALYFVPVPVRLRLVGTDILVPNHDDFNKENNYYKNLTWMTLGMNNQWNWTHEKCLCGEDAINAKSTNEEVEKICELLEKGYMNQEIRKMLNLPETQYYESLITSIRNGTRWKSISRNYNIENKNTLRRNSPEHVEAICQLIEKGYSVKQMREELSIPDKDKAKFKKLVWFIRNRKCYKDISYKYNW